MILLILNIYKYFLLCIHIKNIHIKGKLNILDRRKLGRRILRLLSIMLGIGVGRI